jgi:flagellar basal-body rod modification protein FlgD
MASAISALTGSSSAATTSSAAASSGGLSTPPSEEMFLKLLVSQMQNQDPLNPTDSTQFVSQLAQFSELEQVIAIRQDIESNTAAATQAGTTGTGTTTPPTTPTTSGTTSTGQIL